MTDEYPTDVLNEGSEYVTAGTEGAARELASLQRERQAAYAAKHREKSKAQGRPDARTVQAAVFNALSHRLMIAQHNKRSDEVVGLQGILMEAAVELYKTYDKTQVLDKISSMHSDHRE